MIKEYTVAELETKFEKKYYGNYVSLSLPGYATVYGMVDRIGVEIRQGVTSVIVMMNQKRYAVSLECLYECLKLLTTKHGHTSGS